MNASTIRAPMENGTVILKRTFDQKYWSGSGLVSIRFWRVMGPTNHKNIGSDLSIDGLKEWGIIQ